MGAGQFSIISYDCCKILKRFKGRVVHAGLSIMMMKVQDAEVMAISLDSCYRLRVTVEGGNS